MNKVGVVVGRFQVDSPHEGHRMLLEEVHKKHGKVLICLGCSPVRLSPDDPLDYPTRARMMQTAFPWATIVPLEDYDSDEKWSQNLDTVIAKTFPTDSAILYGSRESFIPRYSGKWPTKEIETITVPSGTDLRRKIAQSVRDSRDFRAGVIYACANRFPISYQTVDIGIIQKSTDGKPEKVLLCRKSGEDGLRFIGGFMEPGDDNLETRAKREVFEEANIEIRELEPIGSMPVDDWRYRGRNDGIMTFLFAATYIFGSPQAGDDVEEVRWVRLESLPRCLTKEHQPLGIRFLEHIKEQNERRKS
ncbi:MAG: NUDIX domain-containing protein [Candidatus Yanofskybacteria bacterium]|nr:NUDIX domain-containing protein [Candidatus Yanofskybacteria bacterium]